MSSHSTTGACTVAHSSTPPSVHARPVNLVKSSTSIESPPHRAPYFTTVTIKVSAGTVALLLLAISATFHSLAKYFYSYYRLIFGTLYPTYASYKAIKNKNIKEYSRWMMFWVSFGMFSFVEVFTDLLLAFWLPFYHEIKILFILWLMSPYGNGAKVMYKNIIHPELERREEVIDSYIERAKEIGIISLFSIWSKASDAVNVLAIRMIHMTQAIVLSHMERMVNSAGEASSPYLLSLPSSSSSSSPLTDTSSTRVMSVSDVTSVNTTRHGHTKSIESTNTGDVRQSLKLLDDAINCYEDTSPVSELDVQRHFADFSSSQGETTEEDEPRANNLSSGNTFSSRVTLTPFPRSHRNTSTYRDTSYNDTSSVEASRSRLEERIEARIRRNRIRPPLRASIFLDSTHSDTNVFSRR